jgi:hypothetical protein
LLGSDFFLACGRLGSFGWLAAAFCDVVFVFALASAI